MEYRRLGRSGLKVSIVGLGCNDFGGRWDLEHSREVITHALDAGVNLFDTSDVYPSPAGGGGDPPTPRAPPAGRPPATPRATPKQPK
ncbi:MAG: aldo/keto reductase [Chloroflexi bacterium]|nr:aldo/keto reductase [Chloroflexota bacterium]